MGMTAQGRLGLAVLIAASVLLAGCAKSKVIDGKKYEAYGLATTEREDPKIRYEVSFASVCAGVIFFETILAPIYVAGWNLYEPVGKKPALLQANEVSGSP